MSAKKQRKMDRKCRIFSEAWEEQCFFTGVGSIAVCLICGDTVSV